MTEQKKIKIKTEKLKSKEPKAQKDTKKASKAVIKESKEVITMKSCSDRNCPKHSGLRTHGRVFVGTVVSDKMQGTINVEWPRKFYIQKYERYEKRRSRVKAHNPECISAKQGDMVKIAECRPIAKTVSFVVIEVLNGK